MSYETFLFALLGGVLPALLWLWFWLKEDKLHPEPRRLIILTFLGGMLVVALALPAERGVDFIFKSIGLSTYIGGFFILFVWAAIEEIFKFLAAKNIALNKKEFDEPIDALIYLITAAVGFAAMENILFLVNVVDNYGLEAGILTGNLRFAGATLLHVLSSSIVGAGIAFSFFHKECYKRNLFWGLLFATLLHTAFNFFIIRSSGEDIFRVFLPLWSLIIVLLILFEKVKKIKK